MQWLYRVIGQAGIFLICAQTVVHFRPKESYDKYLKLLLSVMLLLQLLQPVLTAFGGGEAWNVEEQVAGFTEELQMVLTWASEQADRTEGEVQNTANAVAGKAGEEYGQPTEEKAHTENAESDGIHVEVGPIRLE